MAFCPPETYSKIDKRHNVVHKGIDLCNEISVYSPVITCVLPKDGQYGSVFSHISYIFSLPLTVFLMVWLRGGIRSRSDVIGGFKISLKVMGALTGVLFVTMVLVEISELLLA